MHRLYTALFLATLCLACSPESRATLPDGFLENLKDMHSPELHDMAALSDLAPFPRPSVGAPCPVVGVRDKEQPDYLCWFKKPTAAKLETYPICPKKTFEGVWYSTSHPLPLPTAVFLHEWGVPNKEGERVDVIFSDKASLQQAYVRILNVFAHDANALPAVKMTYGPPGQYPASSAFLFADPSLNEVVTICGGFSGINQCITFPDRSGRCTIPVQG